MSGKALLSIGVALILALALGACGSSSGNDSAASRPPSPPLTGAGSTLIKPVMSKWQAGYEKATGEKVSYRTVENGLDLKPVAFEKTEFGVSDAPITPVQFGEGSASLVMMPWALTGLAVVYNVKGAPKGLRLNADLLGGILLGKVARWNDPKIAALNPGAQLPSTPITPILRRDESGEDYVLSDYLVVYKGAYQKKFGITRRLILTTKLGRVTKGGVSSAVAKTAGAIGAVPLPYARGRGLDVALLENPAGKFPEPNAKSLLAGAEAGIEIGPNNEVWLKELPTSAKTAYPLVTFSYAAVPNYAKPDIGRRLKDFVSYAIGPAGQANVSSLHFVPLPEKIVAADKRTMHNLFYP